MSTWICKPARAASLATLLLAGCLGQAGLPTDVAVADEATTLQLAGGPVTLKAPVGYCVDPAATATFADSGFVLFASCAVLTGATAFAPDEAPGLLTASVGGPESAAGGDTRALAAFLRSDAGRATLSRKGKAGTVRILAEETREGVLFMLLHDASPGPAPALGHSYWRAWFDLGSRLVGLAVHSPEGSPGTEPRARALIEQFVRSIRAANSASAGERAAGGDLPRSGPAVLLV